MFIKHQEIPTSQAPSTKFVPSGESHFHNYDIYESYLLFEIFPSCWLALARDKAARFHQFVKTLFVFDKIWFSATRKQWMDVNDPRLYNNFNSESFVGFNTVRERI